MTRPVARQVPFRSFFDNLTTLQLTTFSTVLNDLEQAAHASHIFEFQEKYPPLPFSYKK
jgi:hypothetical protein